MSQLKQSKEAKAAPGRRTPKSWTLALRSAGGFAGIEFGSFFNWRAGFAVVWPAGFDRFEVFLDAIEDFVH